MGVLQQRRGRALTRNPWLRGPSPEEEEPPQAPDEQGGEESAAVPVVVRPTPQAGITLPPGPARFPTRVVAAEPAVTVWWVGAHGGAGESTLEQLLEGSRAAGHAWPLYDQQRTDRPPVAIVARTDVRGLQAAQRLAAEWASGHIPVDLLGLVLIADAPGRLPRSLKDLAALVAGGVPTTWRLPWVEAWRTSGVSAHRAPRTIRTFIDTVREQRRAIDQSTHHH